MLRIIYTIIAGSLFTAATAQAPFQGLIRFKAENKAIGETSEISWYLKNGNSRLDIRSKTAEAQAEMSLVFVKGSAEAKLISTDNGKTVVYPVPYSSFANNDFSGAFGLEATGQKSTFAGFECEEYTMQTANGTVSCWVSKTTGISPASFPSVILGRGIFSVLMQNGIQGIPVKITSKDFAGNVVLDQEMISAEPMNVSDDRFSVPEVR